MTNKDYLTKERCDIVPFTAEHIAWVVDMYFEKDSFKFVKPHKGKSKQYYLDFLATKIAANKSEVEFWVAKDRTLNMLAVI